MDDATWFKQYDESLPSFRWFIMKYFNTDLWLRLQQARADSDKASVVIIMNDIWFLLPDNRFNIIENPVGWSEFLALIED